MPKSKGAVNPIVRKAVARLLGKKRLPANIELDHIIPKSFGGTDDPSNLQFLTKKQHALKTAYENAVRARLRARRLIK
jgi:5-methylcytosine-specific restriction endonuclease McrA